MGIFEIKLSQNVPNLQTSLIFFFIYSIFYAIVSPSFQNSKIKCDHITVFRSFNYRFIQIKRFILACPCNHHLIFNQKFVRTIDFSVIDCYILFNI